MNKAVIGIGNVVNKAAEKYPIINTALNNPIKAGAVIGVAAVPLIVGGVYATGGAITCGVVCPAATVAGGSIAGTAARFGNTIKDTATKIGNSANSLVQKGASTVTNVGSSPATQSTQFIKIGDSFGKLGTVIGNQAGKITLVNDYAKGRVLERGLTLEILQKTVSNPLVRLSQAGGQKILYLTREAVVVVDSAGRVVTTYATNQFGVDIKNILNMVK